MSLRRNIVANYAGRAYSMGAIYLFVPFYLKILGVEAYGLIAFYAIILTITSVADIGLSAAFSREAARENEPQSLLDLLKTIEGLLFLTSALVASLVILFAKPIASNWLNIKELSLDEAANGIRLMALSLPFQMLFSLYFAGLMGLQRQVSANAVQALYVTVRSGLVIPAIAVKSDIATFFLWQFAANFVFAIVIRHQLRNGIDKSRTLSGKFALGSLRPIISFAGGMLVISILASVNTQIDKLFVSKMFNLESFSHYALASTIAQLPYVAVTPLLGAIFPKLVALHSEGKDEAMSIVHLYSSHIVTYISVASASFLILFCKDILRLWLQMENVPQELVDVSRILSLGGLFLAIGSSGFYFGLAHGHNRTSMLLGIYTLFVSGPLIYFLSRPLGLAGAALPWLFLNLITFSALVLVTTLKFFTLSKRRYAIFGYVFPFMLAIAPIVLAKAVTSGFDLSRYSGVLLAIILSICVFLIYAWRARSEIMSALARE